MVKLLQLFVIIQEKLKDLLRTYKLEKERKAEEWRIYKLNCDLERKRKDEEYRLKNRHFIDNQRIKRAEEERKREIADFWAEKRREDSMIEKKIITAFILFKYKSRENYHRTKARFNYKIKTQDPANPFWISHVMVQKPRFSFSFDNRTRDKKRYFSERLLCPENRMGSTPCDYVDHDTEELYYEEKYLVVYNEETEQCSFTRVRSYDDVVRECEEADWEHHRGECRRLLKLYNR
jgi:hypothetical protein